MSVDLPFVRNNCTCWTLHTIPCCQDLSGTRSYHSMCVSACFGYFGCFDGSAICISPSFGQKYSMAGLEQRIRGTAARGPLHLTPALLSECHLSTQEESARQSVQAPCLHFVYKDIVKDRTKTQKTLCPSTEKIEVLFFVFF